jgi:hypothetical protein
MMTFGELITMAWTDPDRGQKSPAAEVGQVLPAERRSIHRVEVSALGARLLWR